ncbi:MAG: hypothetical protein CMK30_04020 [Porticoccaceae bacterium]|nr:hypothetical protein [Porticoccaceae bacterium]
MQELKEICPFCWESIWLLVDPSEEQTYTEDCHICCRPILIKTTISDNQVTLIVAQEDVGF